MLFSASVFPAFALGKEFTGSERKGFTAAVLTALMPDGVMAAFTMSESVLWPLALTNAYFCFRVLTRKDKKARLLAGLTTALVYFTKPGAAAFGAAFLVLAYILNKDARRSVLFSLPAMLLTAVLGYGLFALTSGSFTVIGLYTKQTSDWVASHALIALASAALMAVFFAGSLNGAFLALPFLYRKEFDADRRCILYCSLAGTTAVLLGTAVFVAPYEWEGEFLYMRYIAMFLPLFIVFTLGTEAFKKPFGKRFPLCMLVFCALFLAAALYTALNNGIPGAIHNFAAGAFVQNSMLSGKTTGILYTVLLVLFALYEGLSCRDARFTGSTKGVMTGALVFFLVFTNVCGYVAASVRLPEGVAEDAEELNSLIGTKTALGITGQRYDDYHSYWQEGYLTRPMQQVTFDQIASETATTGGVYVPFTPVDQSPNKGNGPTPDTDTLVFGQYVREHIELSPSVELTETKHGVYAIGTITPGERWADTMLYGLDGNLLSAGTEALLLLFDGREGNMTLTLTVTAPQDTTVTVTQNGNAQTETVSGTAVLTFPLSATGATVTADKDIEITAYSTK